MSAWDIGLVAQERVDSVGALAAAAESLGFGGIWVADSQHVFRDPWAALALAAERTERIRLATGVTNPVTRHPATIAGAAATLDELSGGRFVLGIGVGESAVRNAGLRPARLAELERAIEEIRRGVPWAPRPVPVVIAATGPKALRLAGRVGDGALIQAGATPELVGWALERVGEGGRSVESCLRLGCAVGPEARESVRAYAAAAARTISVAVPEDEWPAGLGDDLRRLREAYDYGEHVGAEARHRAALSDRLLDAVAVAGSAEEVGPRLLELAPLVDRVVLVVTGRDREGQLRELAGLVA